MILPALGRDQWLVQGLWRAQQCGQCKYRRRSLWRLGGGRGGDGYGSAVVRDMDVKSRHGCASSSVGRASGRAVLQSTGAGVAAVVLR